MSGPHSFEWQISSKTERHCGAAALCMVFRDFGLEISQKRIWDDINTPVSQARPNEFRIETYRLASYARKLGIHALIGRLREPFTFFKEIQREPGYRFILNHRVRSDSPLGHFTVFVAMNADEDVIEIHDPQMGPNRIVPRAELEELWKPFGQNCEIAGNVGILFFREDTNRRSAPIHWSTIFVNEIPLH